MGRITASRGDARSSNDRKDARAKFAKHTINKVIPALLQSDARAKKGVDAAKLIIDGVSSVEDIKGASTQGRRVVKGKHEKRAGGKRGRRRNEDSSEDDQGDDENAITSTKKSSATSATMHNRGAVTKTSISSFSVRILHCDTLTAAHTLLSPTNTSSSSTKVTKRGSNVAILNMASPLRPGGGVLNGAVAQEESLCIRTTVYPSLKEEWYRLPELGMIWTPNVCVFRDEEGKDLSKVNRWYIDVISAAALRFPDVVEDFSGMELEQEQRQKKSGNYSIHDEYEDDSSESDNHDDSDDDSSSDSREHVARRDMKYTSAKDRTLMMSKMTSVLKTLSMKGTTKVVLGAWGCGAYGNPVSEIAKAWKAALYSNTQNWTDLREVVFAIKEGRMAEEFAKEFGQDIAVEILRQALARNRQELVVEDPRVKEREELEERVKDLERQVEQTRFPELRERLELVLEGLKAQLSKDRDKDEDEDD